MIGPTHQSSPIYLAHTHTALPPVSYFGVGGMWRELVSAQRFNKSDRPQLSSAECTGGPERPSVIFNYGVDSDSSKDLFQPG